MKPQIAIFERPTLRITSIREDDRHYYLCWRPDISCFQLERKALLKWCKWPPKTPTGDALRAWLLTLEGETPVAVSDDGALAPEDPNYATRTVI
ncbi:MAG: hypothetical protein ACO3GP_09790 [Candidatus Limnocylindrus sp.]